MKISNTDKEKLRNIYKAELIKNLESRVRVLAKSQTEYFLGCSKPEESIDAQVAKTIEMLNAMDTPIESLIPNQGK